MSVFQVTVAHPSADYAGFVATTSRLVSEDSPSNAVARAASMLLASSVLNLEDVLNGRARFKVRKLAEPKAVKEAGGAS